MADGELPQQLRHLSPYAPKKRSPWALWALLYLWYLQIAAIFALTAGLYHVYYAAQDFHSTERMPPKLKRRLVPLTLYVSYSALLVILEISLKVSGALGLRVYVYMQWAKFSGAMWFSFYYMEISGSMFARHRSDTAVQTTRVMSTPKLAVNKHLYLDPRIMMSETGWLYPAWFLSYYFNYLLYVSPCLCGQPSTLTTLRSILALVLFIPALLYTFRDRDDGASTPAPPPPPRRSVGAPDAGQALWDSSHSLSLSSHGPMDLDPLQHRRRHRLSWPGGP